MAQPGAGERVNKNLLNNGVDMDTAISRSQNTCSAIIGGFVLLSSIQNSKQLSSMFPFDQKGEMSDDEIVEELLITYCEQIRKSGKVAEA